MGPTLSASEFDVQPLSRRGSARFEARTIYSVANVDPGAARSSLGYTKRVTRRRTMKVMLILKATPQLEAGEMPDPANIATMEKFIQEMHKAGVLLDAGGLMPSKHGARVTYSGKQRS